MKHEGDLRGLLSKTIRGLKLEWLFYLRVQLKGGEGRDGRENEVAEEGGREADRIGKEEAWDK